MRGVRGWASGEGLSPDSHGSSTLKSEVGDRTVLEAMAYDWCQRFAKEHPSVMNVFYEDDAFVCYYFRQETGTPAYVLNLDPKETY